MTRRQGVRTAAGIVGGGTLVLFGIWAIAPRALSAEDASLVKPGMTLTEAETALGRPPDEDYTSHPKLDPESARIHAGIDPIRRVTWYAGDSTIIAHTNGERVTSVGVGKNDKPDNFWFRFWHRFGL